MAKDCNFDKMHTPCNFLHPLKRDIANRLYEMHTLVVGLHPLNETAHLSRIPYHSVAADAFKFSM